MGAKLTEEAIRNHRAQLVECIYADIDAESQITLPLGIQRYQVPKDLFAELDLFGTKSEILVASLPQIRTWEPEAKTHQLTLFCPLGDPANVGALIRSAVAFGVDHFVILKESAHPFHPKSVRASSGSVLQIDFSLGPSIHEIAQIVPCIALDTIGEPLHAIKWPEEINLLVGEEGLGLSDISGLRKITIPTTGKTESLNATSAVSIVLFEIFKKKAILARRD